MFVDNAALFYTASKVLMFLAVVTTTSSITCMIKHLIHVAMAPLTVYVGTSHIISIYHIPSPAGFMVTSHTSQHQCAKRTQHLKLVISILKDFVKNE